MIEGIRCAQLVKWATVIHRAGHRRAAFLMSPLAILIPLLLFLLGLSGAGVAQLVEHLICNQRVGGSIPSASSTRNFAGERGRSESSQEKRTGWCLLPRVLFVFLRGMPASC